MRDQFRICRLEQTTIVLDQFIGFQRWHRLRMEQKILLHFIAHYLCEHQPCNLSGTKRKHSLVEAEGKTIPPVRIFESKNRRIPPRLVTSETCFGSAYALHCSLFNPPSQAAPGSCGTRMELGDVQFFLHFFERDALGFGVDEQDYEELQEHHGGKKHEGDGF
jgi:hypothetical protein